MWYETEKEAEEARIRKEIEFNMKFEILKDSEEENVYWVGRKIPR